MKRILTILLVVFTFLIIAGITFLFIKGSSAKNAEGGAANTVNVKSETEKKEYVSFSPGESFITNIKDSTKYLKVKIVLEIRSEKSKAYFEKNNYKIKDIIISVLRSKTEQDLYSLDAQEVLKESIKTSLGNQLSLDDLINIYIEEFVIQ